MKLINKKHNLSFAIDPEQYVRFRILVNEDIAKFISNSKHIAINDDFDYFKLIRDVNFVTLLRLPDMLGMVEKIFSDSSVSHHHARIQQLAISLSIRYPKIFIDQLKSIIYESLIEYSDEFNKNEWLDFFDTYPDTWVVYLVHDHLIRNRFE